MLHLARVVLAATGVLFASALAAAQAPPPAPALDRPAVGVAFGGGSARGLAHVGVLRWFEEHHIPIDLAAGTSMGGLIGGAFATGMTAAELTTMLDTMDWDQMFGGSNFAFKNIRRKTDGRAYPARLEFGLKRGIVPPTSLNSGTGVEQLIGRLTAPYYGISTFDDLPTPFRAVAVDLLKAQPVVLDRGSLALAMRATMSLPLIFPPVELDGQVLVDGGAMNNVPADVVRAMGAQRVVAINVGDLSDRTSASRTLLGLAGDTIDAMMRSSTRDVLRSADVVINVPLGSYGSLDWRRSTALIDEGYKAAEASREQLLPLAIDGAAWVAWVERRQARRRSVLPTPAFVVMQGVGSSDQARMEVLLARHIGHPLDLAELQKDLAELTGIDRYQTIAWSIVADGRGDGLVIRAHPKPYAPPFFMLGLSLENTTSDDFRVQLAGRYLSFDVLGSGSELRLDAAIGSDPRVGAELYRPVFGSTLFVAPYADVTRQTINFIEDERVVARYSQTSARIGFDVGVNLGRKSDLRAGGYVGQRNVKVRVGDPTLPRAQGKEIIGALKWRFDGQDSPVVPSHGIAASATLRHVVDGADVQVLDTRLAGASGVTQLSGNATSFWSLGRRNRAFVVGGAGTTFDDHPLATEQFGLGAPFLLGAYNAGEVRGAHYGFVTGGVAHEMGRLPDFLGGAIFAAGWLENGDAFDQWSRATVRTNVSAGLLADTLAGPVIVAASAGLDGRWRWYVGVGRIFR